MYTYTHLEKKYLFKLKSHFKRKLIYLYINSGVTSFDKVQQSALELSLLLNFKNTCDLAPID